MATSTSIAKPEKRPWRDKFGRALALSLTSVALTVVLTWLVIDVQSTLRQFEHRLTVLETRAELQSGQTVLRGGFPWLTSKGSDFTPEGQIRLALDIDILSEQFRWKCGSSTQVVQGEADVDLAEIIHGYSSDQQLRDARGIIALGTASTEGLQTGQEELAHSRVETLINRLQDNISRPELPLYGYWLGQFAEGDHGKSCTPDTANQRRVVLLKIVSMKAGLSQKDIEASIAEILLQKASTEGIIFPIDIRNYTRFRRHHDMLIWGRNLKAGGPI